MERSDTLSQSRPRCDACLVFCLVLLIATLLAAASFPLRLASAAAAELLLFALFCFGCLVAALLLCVIAPYSLYAGIPPLPSTLTACQAMVEAVPTVCPQKQFRIAELGCGWGELAISLATHFQASTITAFEVSPLPYAVARCRGSRLPNLQVCRRDFLEEDLGGYDLVVCYLSPWHMERLCQQLATQIRQECVLVSSTFEVSQWPVYRTVAVQDPCACHMFRAIGNVFVYRIKPSDQYAPGGDLFENSTNINWLQMTSKIKVATIKAQEKQRIPTREDD